MENNKCKICGAEYFLPDELLIKYIDEQCLNKEICLNNLKLKQERRREFGKRKQQEEKKRKKREEKKLAKIEAERRHIEEQLWKVQKWDEYRESIKKQKNNLYNLEFLTLRNSIVRGSRFPYRIGSKLNKTNIDYNGCLEDF